MEQMPNQFEQQNERVHAFSPQEVRELKQDTIPSLVFATINRLLAEKLTPSGQATIKQNEIIAALVEGGLDKREIFDKHWLDIEDYYRAAGWGVTYDKPGWNENYYEARFEFQILRPNRSLGTTATRNCMHCS